MVKSSGAASTTPQARHGPYFSLTRAEEGKTRSRYLSAEQAALARRQVEAGQQFRKQVETYWQACEQWAETELEASGAATQGAAKKGAPKRLSKSRWSPSRSALRREWNLEAIETAVRRMAMRVAARAVEQRLYACQ